MDPGFRRDSESGSCQFFISVWTFAQPHRDDRRRWVSLSAQPILQATGHLAMRHRKQWLRGLPERRAGQDKDQDQVIEILGFQV
jgi:hypothetical protein